MLDTGPRAFLVDASIYIFRAWFSLPDRWHSPDGMPLNAVYGYTGFVLDLLKQLPVTPVAFAFDESLGSCFRNEIYPGYKASRELPDEALAFQLNACREVTERLDIPCFSGPRFEADDYLATLASRQRAQGQAVSILTRDKDLGQILVDEADTWWNFSADENLDSKAFANRFGVPPARFADYLALVGDPVDDIPGVPGIGAKTAAALIDLCDDLPGLLASPDIVAGSAVRGAARIAEKLDSHKEQVMLARRLTGLADDIDGIEAVGHYQARKSGVMALVDYLGELGLQDTALGRRWRQFGEAL